MIKLLIAEDSPTIRTLLYEVFSSDPEFKIVGVARNGMEAVDFTKKYQPDVITMDIRMPLLDGFEATKEIMIKYPTPIVILSGHVNVEDEEVAMRALQMGALSLVRKPHGPEHENFKK